MSKKKNTNKFNFEAPKFIVAFFDFILDKIGRILWFLLEAYSDNKNESKSESNQPASESQVVCPRCYGKAYVDLNDIKRLGMEHRWQHAGPCGYCDGSGRVSASKVRFVSPRLGSNVDRP